MVCEVMQPRRLY